MIVPPQSTRLGRASIGSCIGAADETSKKPMSPYLSVKDGSGRNSLIPPGSPTEGGCWLSITDSGNTFSPRNRMRRRSTRRRLSQVQKAVNFNEWSNKKVQASDNYFFEQIAGPTPINYKISSSNFLITNINGVNQEKSLSRKSSHVTAVDFSSGESEASTQATITCTLEQQNALSRLTICDDVRALHDLYVEALYTIVHKVGKSSLPLPEAQLIRYTQSAFQIDDRTHLSLMDRARKEKPPIFLLNVQLLEGKDLIAKDINGFSDPYAMLGVIPGKRHSGIPGFSRNRVNSGFMENGGGSGCSTPGSSTAASIIAAGNAVSNLEPDECFGYDKFSPPISPSYKERSNGGGNMLQRFGGSFRRKLQGSSSPSGSHKFKSESKAIPAKLIKASSVQYKTLNPKWNEKFQFVVDDVNTDKFHIDIWDYDDKEQCVLDAVKSLNQISGLKGLGRYFKEVTQSARAGSNDLVDDFLGSDIPSSGLEDWFVLDKRSEKSEVSGAILLRLWLSTKEERAPRVNALSPEEILNGILEQEGLTDVRQHIELIRQFALHEIRSTGILINQFQGIQSEAAVTILHQHAIQGDLTELHQLMCQWLAYSVMSNAGLSYAFLYDILTNLISKWKPLALDKEEENMLAESFESFNEYCRKLIYYHRTFGSTTNTNTANVTSTNLLSNTSLTSQSETNSIPSILDSSMKRCDVDAFGNMIRCVKLLRESPIYCKCIPFHKEFDNDVVDILVDSANAYFASLKEGCNSQQVESLKYLQRTLDTYKTACEKLYALIRCLNCACAKIPVFDIIFKTYAEIEYGMITYLQFDNLLFEYISSEMMSERQTDLKSMLHTVPEDELTLIMVLKIHCVMNEFASFRKPKLKFKMEDIDWGTTFDRTIAKWLDLARVKAFARIDLACQLDAQVQISVSNEIRHTSSYVDICHIVEQLMWVWEHIQVRDIGLHVELTEKLVQMICKLAEYYVDRVMAQLAADGFCGQLQPYLPPALINIFCAAINNSEQIRRVLALGEKLRIDELTELYEKSFKKEAQWRLSLEKELEQCEKYIGDQIEQSVERLVRRQTAQLKKHIFHLAWSPAACPVEQSLKPLTDMLDAELSLVHRTLLHRNFVRVMHGQVNILLQLLQECINENSGLEPNFYQRLSEAWTILMDFFHAEGKGISMESFTLIPEHKALVSQLQLNQLSTIKLIELYYKELLKEQNEVNECKYGILNLRAYYNCNSQTLVIDVIGAKQVIPLDSNGLSDPFVVIELVPRLRYPNQPLVRTKVVSKSLNPIFDETFEFQISPNLVPGAMVHFVVMDHDFLRSNDFAGEALLDLVDVPGFAQAGALNTLRQFNLILIHPSRNTKDSVGILASRKDDKDAQEFVRTLNMTY